MLIEMTEDTYKELQALLTQADEAVGLVKLQNQYLLLLETAVRLKSSLDITNGTITIDGMPIGRLAEEVTARRNT